jgi:hypothetical protein
VERRSLKDEEYFDRELWRENNVSLGWGNCVVTEKPVYITVLWGMLTIPENWQWCWIHHSEIEVSVNFALHTCHVMGSFRCSFCRWGRQVPSVQYDSRCCTAFLYNRTLNHGKKI